MSHPRFHLNFRALALLFTLALFADFRSKRLGFDQIEATGEQSRPFVGAVTMSVAPYRFIVDRLSDQRIACFSIVPPGSDPHHFEPTLSHIAALRRSDLVLLTGEPCERQFLASLNRDHEAPLLDLRTTCSLLPAPSACSHHQSHGRGDNFQLDGVDTHLWLSPKRLIDQTRAIAQALQERFPALKQIIATRAEELIEQLDQLDQSLKQQLDNLSIKTVLVSHPALTYFCSDYGLEQLSAEDEGRHVTARQQTLLLAKIKARKIKRIIIIQPHSEKAADQIAKNLNLQIDRLNPYGDDPIVSIKRLCACLIG